MEKYTPTQLANYFIKKYGVELSGISHMKLQKLVYMAYGWWLAYKGTKLLKESPQMWRFGPVYKSMYDALKWSGSTPIIEPQQDHPFKPPQHIADRDNTTKTFLDWTWKRYGGLTAIELSDLTHKMGTPWYEIANEHNFSVPRDLEIDDAKIQSHFIKLSKTYFPQTPR